MQDIQMKALTLGTIICRFTVPQSVIDEINTDYDKAKDLEPANEFLAGKIVDEFKVTEILSNDAKGVFRMCFKSVSKNNSKTLVAR